MRATVGLVLCLASLAGFAHADPHQCGSARAPAKCGLSDRVHAELDPLPFARGGYGGQLGIRPSGFGGLRLAIASFALDVPDFAVQLGGNDGFHGRVRPSAAVYVLYYPALRNGWAFGGALRYLRLRYQHDDAPGEESKTSEISPELIVGYKWHPSGLGFYLQPWLGLSSTLWRSEEIQVGTLDYDPLPVQAFFTVNLGWELEL